ncbi:ATP-binding cassette domain-containing protein [Floricoccus penangensis]|uniref:ATP-binding cassette domain-containing protein n=1 Tax=Floricoccus penangensis TaxID=1859475 RepID=UPI0009F3B64C
MSPSGGEVQRISISRTLLDQPQLLLLDEVTSALDKGNQKFVEVELLKNFKGTVISVSHNYSDESLNYYDYIVEINNSNISVINKTDLQKNKPHNN